MINSNLRQIPDLIHYSYIMILCLIFHLNVLHLLPKDLNFSLFPLRIGNAWGKGC